MLVFNSTIFKQQLTDISTVLNNTGNTTQLLTSFTALDGVQQKVLLSSKLLSEEQKAQCATMATLSAANTKYTAEQIAKTTGISAETLASWGLTKSTDTLTISELAEKAASDSQAKSALEKIITQNAQAVANGEVTASNITLTASEGTATLATGAFTTAIKANISAMWAWMTTNPLGWITLLAGGIFVAVKAYDALTVSVEEQKEKAEELISTYETALDTANSHKKSIDDVADRYEELAKGVNDLGENVKLTSEEYSEYNSIVNDIADMFPTMVQGYTEEGNAILKLKGNVDALREAYEAEAQAAYNTLIATGEDTNGNDILKDANNVIIGSTLGAHDWGNAEKIDYLDKLMNATSSVDDMLNLWDESLDSAYSSWFEDFAGVGGTVNIGKLTNEDLANIRKNAKILKQQYQAEIDSAVDNTETLANAYLMTNEDYAKLDEQSKTAASIMVNSLNADIVSKFGEDKENVGKYVDDIVQILLSNPDAKNAMIGLFTMDTSDMSVDDIEYWVNEYINTIANILNENPADLKIRLGFDDDTTEPLKTKVQGFLKDEFDDKVGELTQEELDIASKLEIPEGTLLSWDELIAKIREVQGSTFDNETAVLFTETLSDIQNLSKGLDQLDSIMADVINGEEFDWSSILNNDDFKEAFEGCGEVYDDFIKTISESPDDLSKCQSAFDDLATAYVYQSGLLKNLTEETKDAAVNMLSEMGIANAEEVVNSFLSGYTEAIRLAEAANIDFVNATAEEIYALQGLENEFVTAGDSAFNYYLRKKLCSETSISTVADCNALIALAEQCKVTGENLQLLIQLRNIYNVLESDIWSEETKQLATKEAEKIKAQLNNLNVSVNAEYDGGSKVKSALKETEKDVKDTTEKSQAAFKKLMDAELAVLDARMEAGLLKYDDYLKQRLALIESYKGKVADADYYSAIVDNYENELSYMDKVANAIDRIIDKKIDAYNEEIEALEKAHETQMEALETEIEKWEEKKELLQEQNDALEKQKTLEQALYDLERAQSQRSQLVYSGSDRGFIYKQDQEAIRDAQESVRQAKLDIELDNIDKEIERLQKQQDELEEILDSKREAIEKDIESLEEYRDKWSEVSEQYTNSQEDMILSAMYGANAENDILNQRMDILTSFTERYEELQQRQADARLKLAEAEVEAARIEAENLANKESSSTARSSNNNLSSSSSITIPSKGTFFTYSILDRTTKKPVIDDVYETYAEAKLKRKELNNQGYDCYVKSNKYVDGVLKYHNGILGGIVGDKYENISDFEVIKRNSLNHDEISAILQKGEVVLTQDQQHNLAENLKNIDFNPFVSINIPDYTQMLQNIAIREPAQSINVSIGDIQLHGVQNTDTLADAIIREMPGKIIQKIHR